ncbi:hypothetical protein WJX72_005761 [[Myrmecia] bisecta]|uniref:Uncharacterized protein n=1 Tax=[Myrmecia] bisecta TaxID=41462 RepID=A0AAW1PNS9_9CHLO
MAQPKRHSGWTRSLSKPLASFLAPFKACTSAQPDLPEDKEETPFWKVKVLHQDACSYWANHGKLYPVPGSPRAQLGHTGSGSLDGFGPDKIRCAPDTSARLPRHRLANTSFPVVMFINVTASFDQDSPEERDPTPIWQVQPHEDAASYWAKKLQAGTYVSDGRAEGFTDKIRCAQDSHPVSHPPASHLQPLRGLAGQGPIALHGSKMQGAVGGRAGPASCDEPSTQGCYIDQGCTEDVQPLAKSISLGLTSLRKALKPIKVKPPPEKRFGMRHGPGVRDFHTTSAARVEQALIRLNAVLARGGRLPVAASP